MGCDIHVYIEKKVENSNNWEMINLYYVDSYTKDIELVSAYNERNYELFSILAGVRGWHEPFIDPRGIPENASEKLVNIWKVANKDWCHTPSWYDLYELRLFITNYTMNHPENEDHFNDCLQKFLDNIFNYCEFAGKYIFNLTPNQYRVVFWFDD